MKSDKLYAGLRRHDTVLIHCPDRQTRRQPDAMSQRKVAQLLLLFQCRFGQIAEPLAFISWFETKGPANMGSGLYPVARTTKFDVINVDLIERGVHLIPKFGNEIGRALQVKRDLDRQKARDRLEYECTGTDAVESRSNLKLARSIVRQRNLSALSVYTEFWLNTWGDAHIYKIVY